MKNGEKLLKCDVRFDVIDRNLPFMIGLLFLLAMKASVNFYYINLFIISDRVIYHFQLQKRLSHLELSFVCSVTYQRSLRNYDEGRYKVDDWKGNAHLQNAQKNYYISVGSNRLHLVKQPRLLKLPDLEKLHKQLGDATRTQMKTFIRESQTWDASYKDLMDKLILRCPCSLAALPPSRLVCTTNAIPEKNQTQLSINVVYFNRKPFLHVIDDRPRWSEIGLLRTRRLQDQIMFLKRIQFNRHGLLDVIHGDHAFINQPFCQFCQSMEIRFVAVAANHHQCKAIVERANRIIRENIACFFQVEQIISLVDLVVTGTFHQNTSRVHQRTSSFELLYDRTPRLVAISKPNQHGFVKNNIAATR